MEYYVYITNNCNMNCAYCSVLFDTIKYGVPLNPQYSFDELEQFVSNTQAKLEDDVADIYFFGGEPTVDYTRIAMLIEAFRKPHNYKINYIMHTNGLLIHKAPIEIMQEVNLVLLSFNYELIYSGGRLTPYFKQMVNAIEFIKTTSNSPIIGRVTVSPKTSLYTECCLISNFVDYVYWQIDNCESMENYDIYQEQYKLEIELLFKYWMECLKKGVFLRFVPFISAIKNLLLEPERPTKFYCGYGSSMIYIQTNGKCYACCDNVATNSHYIGNIRDGITFPDIDLNNTVCKDCSYIKLCGGRCGRMHKDFSDERISQYCDLNQYMFDLIIGHKDELSKLLLLNEENFTKLIDPMISYTEYTA